MPWNSPYRDHGYWWEPEHHQINNIEIVWSRTRKRWNCYAPAGVTRKHQKLLQEFRRLEDAQIFANQTKDFLKRRK